MDKRVERRRDRDNNILNILHEVKDKLGFVRHPKLKTPDFKKNRDKYCDYHRHKRHNTDVCYHLKN